MAVEYFDKKLTRGRPQLILNEEGKKAVEKLASIMCTDEEIASVLGCCVDTLVNKKNKASFLESKERGQNSGKTSLRRMQYKAAEAGNVTMLIWLGKQFLEQSEKQDIGIPDANISFEIKPASDR